MNTTTPAATIPVRKREIFGWAMYDFANSSYTTVVISVVYSAFFTRWIVPADSTLRDTWWSIAIVLATAMAMVLSPLVGAVCDVGGHKKRYLAAATALCGVATAGLWFVAPGDIALAVALIALSNLAFMLGEAFCASFLTDLSTPRNMALISGLGWGFGYMGGLTSLVLVQFVVRADPTVAPDAHLAQNQLAMVGIALFYVLAAIPTFLLVRERSHARPGFVGASFGTLARTGFRELLDAWKLTREYPVLFQFLLAFTVYIAGLEVIIKFVGIYATGELALTQGQLVVLFLILQVSAAVGALAFGALESKLGPKRTVLGTILWWIVGILAIYFLPVLASWLGMAEAQVFQGIAIVVGAGIGSIQSSSRAMVGLLSPPDRTAQMFGFWGMFMRVGILFGMLFGPLADAVGRRPAILLVLGFFVVGGLMLWRIPIDRGIHQAQGSGTIA